MNRERVWHVFGISGTELFIVVVFALLIFGPDKLPEYGRTIGRFVREFRRAQDQMESMIKIEMSGKDAEKVAATLAGTGTAAGKRTIDDVPEDEDEEEEEED